jgi:hypothetical protein
MESHERARFVIKKDRKAQVDMEKPNETVEGEVMLRCNGHAAVVERFKRLLKMKFIRVYNDQVVSATETEGIEEPCR